MEVFLAGQALLQCCNAYSITSSLLQYQDASHDGYVAMVLSSVYDGEGRKARLGLGLRFRGDPFPKIDGHLRVGALRATWGVAYLHVAVVATGVGGPIYRASPPPPPLHAHPSLNSPVQ